MALEDQEKTAFITPFGIFCYTSMPFVLKNARATYQRTVQNCLKEQIGRNMHAYVDDIVIKSQLADSLISDLTETFKNLRKYQMKLNPAKCTFGVPAGKLLGYIVSEKGIEANPEKINAVMTLHKPASVKGVQRLTGCVAALSRFISRLGEKAIPLYRLLTKSETFVWDDEADQALVSLNKQLSQAPILAAPKPKEPMLLYIAANNRAVSAVIVVERMEAGKEHPLQRPVYYVGEVLTSSKQRYPHLQKLVHGVLWRVRSSSTISRSTL